MRYKAYGLYTINAYSSMRLNEMQHNSEYTKGNTVIATNQSNYPVMIEVYEIDANGDYIKFASNLDKRLHTNKLYYDGKADTYYFNHYGVKYQLNETMTVY